VNSRPPSLQSSQDELFSYEKWRERFLQVVLRGSCILGAIAITLYLFSPSTTVLYKVLAVSTWAILVLVTVLDRLPYRFRAGVFLFLLYLAGFTSLIDHGIGDASILFLGFMVMASLLFSPRSGLYSTIGLTVLTIVLFGWSKTDFLDSARLTAILLVVAVIIAIGLRSFQEEFRKTQLAARQTFDTLRNERLNLEKRVEDRTAGLARKTEQLRATSYIARKTAEAQDLASLLNTVARLVTDQFGFYHTGIFLLNETGDHVVLQAASSEGGQRMIESGHSLTVGIQGIVGYVAAQKKPRIALDVGEDAIFFNNPDLPMTRSEVALPLLIRNRVLGVLDIQSDKPQAFGTEDIDVLQTLSDQIAIAIENTRLLDETQAAIVQLEALTGVRTREVWTQKLREGKRVFTYTPLGLRAEKLSRNNENAITASIILRGQKIGSISIARKGNTKWTKMDAGLLDEVASQVGLAVDNIRLLEEATQRAKHEQTVGELAARFSQSLDLETLLQTAARELGQVPDVAEVSVFLGDLSEDGSTKTLSNRSTG
jgi:GAF domain-containing protein